MDILGIGGSPKKGGVTDLLLESALAGARSAGGSVEKIVLNDLVFRPCQECGGCDKTGVCVLEDDMRPLYKKLDESDAIIVASPIFFGTISAQVKMMIDRLQSAWVLKYVLKRGRADAAACAKKGIFLCAGGQDNKEYFENAKKTAKILFAVLGVKYAGELFIGGVNEKASEGAAGEKALRQAFELGASLVRG
jgi:multimeric flavodoxin WrbA